MLRRMTPSSAQLTGGDLSVDILHTEDSVRLGDGTNLIGAFTDVGGVRSLPVDVKSTVGATGANLTAGTAKFQIHDPVDTGTVEIDDVGGEKALKVSVIAQVGGGSGGTAATDQAAFSAGATQGTPLMGYYDANDSDDLTDTQMGIARMTAERSLYVHQTNVISGFGTAANQTTIIGHIDGLEGLLTTIDVDTGSMDTKLSTIIGHVDGLEGLIGTTNTNTGNSATSLAILDDWDATAGSAHPTDGVMAMGSDGTLARRLLTTTAGRLEVVVNTNAALVASSANIGDVDVASIAAGDNNIGNVDIVTMPSVTLNALPSGTNNIGDVDVLTLPSIPAGTNNIGDIDVLSVTASASTNKTDIGLINAVTPLMGAGNTGTGSLRVTIASDQAAVMTKGEIAHDTAVGTNPVVIAGRAKNTNPTAVADGDTSYLNTDLAGRLVVTFSDRALTSHATGTQTTTTAGTMLAAGGANVFNDMTMLILTNSNTTTAAQVQIRDSAAGTTRFEHMIPANSGMVVNFPVPLKQATANAVWEIDLTAGVSTVYWTAQWVTRLA